MFAALATARLDQGGGVPAGKWMYGGRVHCS
jgi:hypothetical protein